jgi:outer membrane protein assembly factor BamD
MNARLMHRAFRTASSPASRPLGAAALALSLLLGACAGNKDEVPYVERPVEQIYTEALNKLDNKDYSKAAALFDEVERQHPYSQWAMRAQLMAAYSHYEAVRYDDAITTLDRFIAIHPGNRNVAYAYYLKALCYYEQIADVRRDQSMTQNALGALNEVIRRFPNTPYARDARLKIDLTRDHLAGKDMDIGRYYLRVGLYTAAIKRFRHVVDEYATTSHVPEALHRLTESYLALGMADEARVTAATLGHNYPGSDWYEDSYELMGGTRANAGDAPAPKGFFSRAFGGLF